MFVGQKIDSHFTFLQTLLLLFHFAPDSLFPGDFFVFLPRHSGQVSMACWWFASGALAVLFSQLALIPGFHDGLNGLNHFPSGVSEVFSYSLILLFSLILKRQRLISGVVLSLHFLVHLLCHFLF
ncbi:hypothetical protein V2J09_013214 [Rumex salicifolius]